MISIALLPVMLFLPIIWIVFLVLRIFRVVDTPWWILFLPFTLALILLALVGMFILGLTILAFIIR